MNLNDDLPKELSNKVYEAIELARKTGKIKKGSNEVTKAVERGVAKLVIVAKDADPKEIVMHFPALCKEKDIPFVVVPSKEELGATAGLPVKTTAIAIIQEGDSKRLVNDIITKIE